MSNILGLILNETEVVNEFKNTYIMQVKPIIMISLLIKKYHLDECTKDAIYINIMKDLEQSLKKDFIYTKWDTTIRRNIKSFYRNISIYKTKVRMINVESVDITVTELKKINTLNNLVLEKIAFVMLVYAKISNIQLQSKEGWINKSCSMICKEAHVNLRGIEQKRILHSLYELNYIKMRNNNSKINMKIDYIDKDSNTELVISDFDGVVYQYLIWKGEKWKKCNECGKYFKPKSNSAKYCVGCKKKKKARQNKENMQKYRNVVK